MDTLTSTAGTGQFAFSIAIVTFICKRIGPWIVTAAGTAAVFGGSAAITTGAIIVAVFIKYIAINAIGTLSFVLSVAFVAIGSAFAHTTVFLTGSVYTSVAISGTVTVIALCSVTFYFFTLANHALTGRLAGETIFFSGPPAVDAGSVRTSFTHNGTIEAVMLCLLVICQIANLSGVELSFTAAGRTFLCIVTEGTALVSIAGRAFFFSLVAVFICACSFSTAGTTTPAFVILTIAAADKAVVRTPAGIALPLAASVTVVTPSVTHAR